MQNYILYSYNDMASSLVRGYARYLGEPRLLGFSYNTGYENEGIFKINQLLTLTTSFLHRFIHPILLNNLLLLFFTILSIYFAYKFFYLLSSNKYKLLSVSYALIYTFSLYFLYRAMSATPGLYTIFIFPLIIYLLLKNTNSILLGTLTLLFILISNYHGIFSIILIFLFKISEFFYKKEFSINKFKNLFSDLLLFMTPIIFSLVLLFPRLVISNIPLISKNYNESESNELVRYRPIEDYYNFSLRPWYFFIPPKSSTYFGSFSNSMYSKIENLDNYLTDDYSEYEVGASYLGWHFIMGTAFIYIYLIFFRKNYNLKYIKKNSKYIFIFSLIIIFILLFTLPPSITFGNFVLYTPSILTYYIIPFIRTLGRWSIVLFLLIITLNFFLSIDIVDKIKTKHAEILFSIVLLLTNYFVFAIDLNIIDVNKPPPEIAFLKENTSNKKVGYAVLPIGDYDSIFWLLHHNNYLINPVHFQNSSKNFYSEKYSINLYSSDNLIEAKNSGVEYIVIQKYKHNDRVFDKISMNNRNIYDINSLKNEINIYYGPVVFENESVAIFSAK